MKHLKRSSKNVSNSNNNGIHDKNNLASSNSNMIVFTDDDEIYLESSFNNKGFHLHQNNNNFLKDKSKSTTSLPINNNNNNNNNLNNNHISSNGNNLESQQQNEFPLGFSMIYQKQQYFENSSDNIKFKKPSWFEEEQNDFHHFDISFYPSGNRIFLAGETVEIHLKVNVKKLQFLKATFECVSTSHNSKNHTLSKNVIISQDVHLYPTDKDIHAKLRRSLPHGSNSIYYPSTNVTSTTTTTSTTSTTTTTTTATANPVLPTGIGVGENSSGSQSPTQTTTNSSTSSSTRDLPNTTTTSSNNNLNKSMNNLKSTLKRTTSLRKSISHDHLEYPDPHQDEDSLFCPYLEPLPDHSDSEYDDDYSKPPLVHSCSEHELISNRKHKFIFRFTIPSNSPPSFFIQKDPKCGVFYRIQISGLGELHSKLLNTDGPLIKGIQTFLPLVVANPFCTYLPRELVASCSSFGPSETFVATDDLITLKSRQLFTNFGIIGSTISIYISVDNQTDQLTKGFKLSLINRQQSWNPNENIDSNYSTPVSSIRYKSTDYYCQPHSKFNTTISFSIPSYVIPSVALSNIENHYYIKITIRKTQSYIDLPILIVPSTPS
eukprot:gene8415-10333_t